MIHLRDKATVVATGARIPVRCQHISDDGNGSHYRVILGPGTPVITGSRLVWHGVTLGVTARIHPVTDHAGRIQRYEATASEVSDLIDAGTLYRQNGTTYDKALNREVPNWVAQWSGPCLVNIPTGEGSEAEAGQQRITVQPFTVQVPLSLVDIRPDDQFRVTASNDPRLLTRRLQVTRVKAASLAVKREFTAIDNQG